MNALPAEDFVIYLRLPVAQAHRLIGRKAARDYTELRRDLQEADIAHLEAAAQVYDDLARAAELADDRMPRGFVRQPARAGRDPSRNSGGDRGAHSRSAGSQRLTRMGFDEFLGNERIVGALRGMLRSERVPSALLFTGPRGIGKYTLARMFAQAANCERLKDDFCGECATCLRIAALADPEPLIEAGLTERGESADAAMVERMPLILETHPDVWLIVPDPVRLRTPVARPMIRVGQLRAVQRAAYFKPQGRRRVFILDGADTMRWNDADLLAENPRGTSRIRDANSARDRSRFAIAHDPVAMPAISFRAGARRTD